MVHWKEINKGTKLQNHYCIPKITTHALRIPRAIIIFSAWFALTFGTGCGGKKHESDFESIKALAEQGDAGTQYKLGDMYYIGQYKYPEMEKDDKQAIQWFRKAAEQNHPQALYRLGVLYHNGLGVEKDEKEAVKWYRKAAEYNLPEAQTAIGDMYAKGQGVKEDIVIAYAWIALLGPNGKRSKQAIIAGKMTPIQITKAEKLSKELRKKIEANLAVKKK